MRVSCLGSDEARLGEDTLTTMAFCVLWGWILQTFPYIGGVCLLLDHRAAFTGIAVGLQLGMPGKGVTSRDGLSSWMCAAGRSVDHN